MPLLTGYFFRKLRAVILLFVLITGITPGFSQSPFLVTNYAKTQYGAGSQNWSVDIDNQGYVYVANNNGLLVFDGTHWKTYRTKGQAIVRSVYVSPDHKVYTGSFEEFGYWQKENGREFVYHSLKSLLKNYTFHNNEIWKIVPEGNNIYFQSFSSLFVFDQKTVHPIPVPGNLVFLLKAGNRLFIQVVGGSLFELANKQLIEIPGSKALSGSEVKTILPISDGKLLIGTTSDGLYIYDGQSFSSWDIPVNKLLKEAQINNGVIFGDKIILGTIVKGLFMLDFDGNVVNHIDSEHDLQNNTVLALKSDNNQSIWVGLDKGIDNISFNNPIEIYRQKDEQPGAVYSAALQGNTLYIGTNRGVFSYTHSGNAFNYKGIIPNSQGQVWQLREFEGSLLCGHTNGTFAVTNEGFRKISDVSGGFSMHTFNRNGKEYLVQSTYTSLVLFRREGDSWIQNQVVKGFIEPVRYLEVDPYGNLWAAHSVKGLFRLTLSRALDTVERISHYGQKDGFPTDYNIRVFKIANRVVFTTGYKLYTWDDLSQKIIPYNSLNSQLDGFEAATSIVDAGNELHWFITNNEVALFRIHDNTAKLQYRLLLSLYKLSMVDQYENIVQLNADLSLICLDDGFALVDLRRIAQGFSDRSRLIWSEAYSFTSEGNPVYFDLNSQSVVLSHSENNVVFSFSVINSPGTSNLFQYKLEGIDPDWSEWSNRSEVKYTRLPKGSYRFMVRAFSPSGKILSAIEFRIIVKPAWYASTLAYLLYGLAGLFLLWLLLFISRRRLERSHERIRNEDKARQLSEKQQAEQEIITLQNQNLHAEISHKNIQLADSTMAILKKNEVLIEIKNELSQQKELLGSRYPVRYFDKINSLIDKNISNDRDWQLFESLFDQAHENFFKRLKSTYPELTQSDLKLCAYLKLNLASKEIAPLLNISLRGVEIRRYRLRKRLALSTDSNLVEFIMQF